VIYVGLVHDPEHAFRLVDHGPAAASSDAAQDTAALQEFRELWGSKAELRRFKDGRIIESVVWDVKTSDERAQIPTMIVRHLLGYHFGLVEDSGEAVTAWQDAFDGVLRLPEDVVRLRQVGAVAVGFKGAMNAFDALVKAIKAVDGPLSVLSVSPVSEHLRYTGALQPLPRPPLSSVSIPYSATYYPSMDIIIEFEHSSRWPDDLRAIQKMKLAFFEKMAKDLMTAMPGTQVDVVLADKLGVPDIQDRSFLSIVTPDGWAFRARIWLEREAVLLDRMLETKPALVRLYHGRELSAAERKEAEAAKEAYVRRFVHAPRHHRAIASLSHRFSSFSGTVRLVKRWLAAHWVLYGHVREEVVEILCAHVYLRYGPSSHSTPASKEHGFAAVIAFLKEWKWEDGLFVPLYDEEQQPPALTGKDVAVKGGGAGGIWTVSTQFDPSGRVWTSEGPQLVAAHRIQALAKATYESLQAIEDGSLNVRVNVSTSLVIVLSGVFAHFTSETGFVCTSDKRLRIHYSLRQVSFTAIFP
jgi:U3 small nucleolar RNA-associated protein 22